MMLMEERILKFMTCCLCYACPIKFLPMLGGGKCIFVVGFKMATGLTLFVYKYRCFYVPIRL